MAKNHGSMFGNARTTHCCATKATCYCPRMELHFNGTVSPKSARMAVAAVLAVSFRPIKTHASCLKRGILESDPPVPVSASSLEVTAVSKETSSRTRGRRCQVEGLSPGAAADLPCTGGQTSALSAPIGRHMTATAGSDVVQSGRPIFDDFFQHLWPYIGNNTANVVFQIVKRLWLIRIDQ
ncbi:hypothetical protein TNCV_926351 [Trichonephila clavipes]|nr:hypothetical protein TNCV_926351 [Trichonephila clavipes]